MPNPFSKLLNTVQGKKKPAKSASGSVPNESSADPIGEVLYHSSAMPQNPLSDVSAPRSLTENPNPLPVTALKSGKKISKEKHDKNFYIDQMRKLEEDIGETWMKTAELRVMTENTATPNKDINEKTKDIDTLLAKNLEKLEEIRKQLANDKGVSKKSQEKLNHDLVRIQRSIDDLLPTPEKLAAKHKAGPST